MEISSSNPMHQTPGRVLSVPTPYKCGRIRTLPLSSPAPLTLQRDNANKAGVVLLQRMNSCKWPRHHTPIDNLGEAVGVIQRRSMPVIQLIELKYGTTSITQVVSSITYRCSILFRTRRSIMEVFYPLSETPD